MHIRIHTVTISKHNTNHEVPLNHIWVLRATSKKGKNIGNFCLQCIGCTSYTIDSSSCEILRSSAQVKQM